MYKGEYFNSISHLVAALFSLIGAAVLVTLASIEGESIKITSLSIYGVSLFLLYLSSTLYHSFQGRAKRIFQRCDHLAIYLLIAGTYTPVALLAVKGDTGWWLFGAVWALALIGMIIENLPIKGPRVIPIVIYLMMGWACMFTLDEMIAGMTSTGFSLIVAGGITYSVGVIFYVLDNWFKYMHSVWHMFVIGGSVLHYLAVLTL